MKTFPKSKQLKKKKRINLFPKEKTRSKLIKELDKIISDRVRTKANWSCERCGKKYEPPTSGLHCSHYFSRRYLGTRWDINNLCALCYGCHRLVESDKMTGSWYEQFMTKRLGTEGVDMLRIKAYAITTITKPELGLLLQVFEKQ